MAQMDHPAPVEVTYKDMGFLIIHNPINANLNKFIEDHKKYGVTTRIIVCEVTYDTALLQEEGIHILDWPFDDSAPPSNQIVNDWLSLVNIIFCEDPDCCIVIHCLSGLGRAPMLIAIALIEGGMKYEDEALFIKQKWHEAINSKQLLCLEKCHLICSCALMISMDTETTVAFNKIGVPDAPVFELELERGPNLSNILVNMLVNKSK